MKTILFGVGKSILKDYTDPTKVIAYSELQDLSIESSSSQEDITGGDKMFPIASFDNEKTITISATNATFSDEMLPYLEGVESKTEAKKLTTFMEVEIPTDGIVNLPHTPEADSVIINGFEKADQPAAGKYTVAEQVVTFDATDAGKNVNIVYDYTSGANAIAYSATEKLMKKPFQFTHIVPMYDDDSQVVGNLHLTIYKAQCTSGVTFSFAHRAPFAPTFEASARNASRADGKLWEITIEPVTATV